MWFGVHYSMSDTLHVTTVLSRRVISIPQKPSNEIEHQKINFPTYVPTVLNSEIHVDGSYMQ